MYIDGKKQDREFGYVCDTKCFIEEYFPPVSRGASKTRTCAKCGKEYEVRSRNQIYCSIECRKSAERERKENIF